MVTNSTTTITTTIIFILLVYKQAQHGGSKASSHGEDEQPLCHTWGRQLYRSLQSHTGGAGPSDQAPWTTPLPSALDHP